MKAFLVLADAVSTHPDGTFSLLRGGITETMVPRGKPAMFRGALLGRITGTRGEQGTHTFGISCIDEDGTAVLSEINGNFQIPTKGGAVHVGINLQVIFPKVGRYSFSLKVDNQEASVWDIEAKEIDPSSIPGGQA